MTERSERVDSGGLYGRFDECARIDDMVLKARAGVSSALLLSGEPGVGKSSLLGYAREHSNGLQVLTASGNEFDADVSYTGLFDLLHSRLDVLPQLPQPQQDALNTVFAINAAGPGSRFDVALAVLGQLSAIAASRPLIVLVDDAQWWDRASAEALAFVARRIGAEGMAIIIAERTGGRSHFGGVPQTEVQGLGLGDVRALLIDLGRPDAEAAAFIRATAGNPLAVREILSSGWAADSTEVVPARTTETLQNGFMAQVSSLPEGTRRALRYLAATSTHELVVLTDVLDADNLCLDDLRAAEAIGLLVVGPGELTFRHPLIRSAIYHDAGKPELRRIHRGFADVLTAHTDPVLRERGIIHRSLAADVPDDDLADALEQAGHAAARRRGFASAATMLERAALLSVGPTDRCRRYLAAAGCALPAGRIGTLNRLIESTLQWASDDATRVAAARMAYRTTVWQGLPGTIHHQLRETALSLQADAVERSVLLAEAAMAAVLVGERANATQLADEALELTADRAPADSMPAQIVRALLHTLSLDVDQARELLRRAEPHLGSRSGEQWPLLVPFVRFLLDDLPEAAAGVEWVIGILRENRALELLPAPLLMKARIEVRRGDFTSARLAVDEASTLITSMGGDRSEQNGVFLPDCAAAQALLDGLSGDAGSCRVNARTALRAGTEQHWDFMIGHSHRALGLLALGAGEAEAAVTQFRALDQMARTFGLQPTPILPWLADLAEAELLTRDLDAAGRTLSRLHDHAARVATADSIAMVERVSGLVEGEVARLHAAVTMSTDAGMPFEAARSSLLAGRMDRRAKRINNARSELRFAYDVFDALAAAPWREQAAAELRALGSPVPTSSETSAELTAQELHVARLAAGGQSNAEIAGTLFLSRKTVEFHLSNAFRKLGVRRRTQLAAQLPGVKS